MVVLCNDCCKPVKTCHPSQACSEGNRTLCGTVALDLAQEMIEKRIATKLYTDCRTGALTIKGFPNIDPVLKALKEGQSSTSGRSFNVCQQQGSKLLVVQSYASKFLENEITKDDAKALIDVHNSKFNVGGDFWQSEDTRLRKPTNHYVNVLCFKYHV